MDADKNYFGFPKKELFVLTVMICSVKIPVSLWSITAKNTDCSNGPLARPFARGTVNDLMAILSVFFPIFDHSLLVQVVAT